MLNGAILCHDRDSGDNMYICIYLYMYICINTCIYIYIYIHKTYICLHYIYICIIIDHMSTDIYRYDMRLELK